MPQVSLLLILKITVLGIIRNFKASFLGQIEVFGGELRERSLMNFVFLACKTYRSKQDILFKYLAYKKFVYLF